MATKKRSFYAAFNPSAIEDTYNEVKYSGETVNTKLALAHWCLKLLPPPSSKHCPQTVSPRSCMLKMPLCLIKENTVSIFDVSVLMIRASFFLCRW